MVCVLKLGTNNLSPGTRIVRLPVNHGPARLGKGVNHACHFDTVAIFPRSLSPASGESLTANRAELSSEEDSMTTRSECSVLRINRTSSDRSQTRIIYRLGQRDATNENKTSFLLLLI